MFTNIDKNLLIAALESALLYARTTAGVSSLEDLTTQVAALRADFDANPDNVTDAEIETMIATLQAVEIPDPALLSRLFATGTTDPGSYLAVCSWATLLNKPMAFPPVEHRHNWSEIDYKPYKYLPKDHVHTFADMTGTPATFPPDTHAHAYADITSKPDTFPPATHAHAYADMTSKPDTFPPATHAHTYADITSKPDTFPPATHAHAYADMTSKPDTFPPATHAHAYADITSKPDTYPPDNHTHQVSWPDIINKQASYPPSIHTHDIAWGEITQKPSDLKKISFVSWTGNGTTPRALTTTFQAEMLHVIANNGLSGIATSNGSLRTTTATLAGALTYGATSITLNAAELNVSGIGYTAILYGTV